MERTMKLDNVVKVVTTERKYHQLLAMGYEVIEEEAASEVKAEAAAGDDKPEGGAEAAAGDDKPEGEAAAGEATPAAGAEATDDTKAKSSRSTKK